MAHNSEMLYIAPLFIVSFSIFSCVIAYLFYQFWLYHASNEEQTPDCVETYLFYDCDWQCVLHKMVDVG